ATRYCGTQRLVWYKPRTFWAGRKWLMLPTDFIIGSNEISSMKESRIEDYLNPPHGGELVSLVAEVGRTAKLKEKSRDWPSWNLSLRQLCDLELLLTGGFSPLSSFMTRVDYEST